MTGPGPSPLRWRALGVLAMTQFMLLLDDMVVNVALPSIQHEFHVSTHVLAWVNEAYILAYGGFLMLGGRSADLLGRRSLFLGGLSLFGLGSAACGLAQSDGMLIAARAAQGLGAAAVAPAALALVMTLFDDEGERTRALTVWGGLMGLGGVAGAVLGGVVTELGGWRWIFFINLPVALAGLALAPRLVAESRATAAGRGFDLLGAATLTGAITALVYALLHASSEGWDAPTTLACLAAAGALFVAFLVAESRLANPLVRLRFFCHRRRSGANGALALVAMAMFGGVFMLTLYVQNVLGFSPLQTGLTWVPFGLTLLGGIRLTSRWVGRVGARPLMIAGGLIGAVGFLLLSRAPLHGGYLPDLAPGMVLVALGVSFSMVPAQMVGMADAAGDELGLASGLLSTSVQLGGALGLAILAGLASERVQHQIAAGALADVAQVAGTRLAFLGSALTMALVSVVAAAFVGSYKPATEVAEAAPGELGAALAEPELTR
jgi:EmrB/QacA subfamily drug resistance transporter